MTDRTETFGSWFRAHWWQVGVIVFMTGAMITTINGKLDRESFQRYREATALERADIRSRIAQVERDMQSKFDRVNERLDDILSVICDGRPRTLGCRNRQ